MNNKYKWLIYLLVLLSLLLVLIQPVYTWFISDDYCIMSQVQKDGIISSWFFDYLHWDGRSISLTYPVCRAGLFVGVSWLGPLIGSTLMFVLACLMLRISTGLKFENANSFIKVVSVTALLWLVYFNFLSQTLYWTTGVGYNMDVVLLLAAVWWIGRWKGEMRDYLVGIPVFFYAGTCSPNGVLALLFIVLVMWLYGVFIQNIRSHRKYLFALALILLAMTLVVLSPGNKNRMTAWDWKNLTHFWTVYFHLKLLLKNLFNYNSLFVWPLITIGMIAATIKVNTANLNISGMLKRAINLFYEHRFLLAALISFFFFLPLPSMNSPRTTIQFAVFASLYGLSHTSFLLSKISDHKEAFLKHVILLINLIFIITAASQAFDARYVKTQLAIREAKLKLMKGQDVILTEADYVRTPVTRRFEDLASDSSYWLNRCVASHYGLKSIKLVDTRPKKVVMGVITD